MNTLKSHHWFILFLSLFVPLMGVILQFFLWLTDSLIPGTQFIDFTTFYACVVIWWIFACIAGLHPEKARDDVRYVNWLVLPPLTIILINTILDNDQQFEAMLWFNSVLVTWVAALGWILVDWYRWKFNPSERQQRVIARRMYLAKRQAEIDKIPNCVVPSGLTYIPQEQP